MALSIKTDEADELARELTRLTDESLTEAVTVALRERLDRVRHGQRADMAWRLSRLQLEYLSLPVVDGRSPEQIVGYDLAGLPS